MESVINKLEQIQQRELNEKDKRVAESVQKVVEELSKLGFDKKPEYTIPMADTIGKGYYSSFMKTHQGNSLKS